MKENNKLKHIASVLVFILLFQYISMILPFLEVHASTETVDGITWLYTISDGKATINGISSGTVGETVTVPSILEECPVTSIQELRYSL